MPHRAVSQACDQRAGQGAAAHVVECLVVDDVVCMAGAQQAEEVQPALARRGAEPGEVPVADLRAGAVRAPVPRAGVVHRDPARRLQPGAQHVAGLGDEAVLAGDQQPHQLALGDVDANAAQQRQQPRHRDLALMVLRQHEAAQFRPEMAGHPRRQCRGDPLPVRRHPAFAPQPQHMRAQHQVLHHEVLVALEARAGRDRDLDHTVLMDGTPRRLVAATAARPGWCGGRPLGSLLHAARLDLGTALEAFQTGDLTIPRRHLPLQIAHTTEQLDHQSFQLRRRQIVRMRGRRHSRSESQPP